MTEAVLDRAVEPAVRELNRLSFPAPEALLLSATGLEVLPGHLESAERISLSVVPGVPTDWGHLTLCAGLVAGTRLWMLEDAAGEPELGGAPTTSQSAWVRAFPCWLAAAAGATVLVHTSAGSALEVEPAGLASLEPGSLALVSDHLNLSGRTPLLGLGESQLGPLFPDQSRLHHEGLRRHALALAQERGIPAAEAVCACTLGPTHDTPAERAWLAKTGAQIAVQGIANPLIAAAHADLATLAIVCVTDKGEGQLDMPQLVARSEELAPALEDVVTALLPEVGKVARERAEED